jgi:hypothetical protein
MAPLQWCLPPARQQAGNEAGANASNGASPIPSSAINTRLETTLRIREGVYNITESCDVCFPAELCEQKAYLAESPARILQT